MFVQTISGPEIQKLFSFTQLGRFPPVTDIQFSDSYEMTDVSQFDFDWVFFYGYVGVNVKDMILEVRLHRASHLCRCRSRHGL